MKTKNILLVAVSGEKIQTQTHFIQSHLKVSNDLFPNFLEFA